MRVVVLTPPAPLVSLEQAKAHVRMDFVDDDALIKAYVAAATAHLDGPCGWLGRVLGLQTLELRDRCFDTGHGWAANITLPCPPAVSITSVMYLDDGGVEQPLDPAKFEQRGNVLVPVYRTSWPSTRDDDEAVRITYQAGYPELPAPIRAAILLMVGDLWQNRSSTLDGRAAAVTAVPMSVTVESLLTPFRVWS